MFRIVRLVLKSDSCRECNDIIGMGISLNRFYFCIHLDMVSTMITPLPNILYSSIPVDMNNQYSRY